MKYFSIDLELNNQEDGSTVNPKIIEIGLCIGDLLLPREKWIVKEWIIDPEEPIYPFITKLTGIDDDLIANMAQPIEEIASEISKLLLEHKPFVNPVTWGGGDSSAWLDLMKEKKIYFPHFGRRWIDVKTINFFLKVAANKKHAGGLGSAMSDYKLKFEGQAHRAGVDAFNTLRLFFAILERQQHIEAAKNILKIC